MRLVFFIALIFLKDRKAFTLNFNFISNLTFFIKHLQQEQQKHQKTVDNINMATASATPPGASMSLVAGSSSHHQSAYHPQHHTQVPQQPQQQKRPPQTILPSTSAVPTKKKFNFTLEDIDRCLFGKQEMRVVNIDDVGGGESDAPVAPGGRKQNGGMGGPLSKSEDKNKPAKCTYGSLAEVLYSKITEGYFYCIFTYF